MDGYTAFGASITYQGSKQTFICPAPMAVVADLDVICAAPGGMNASGYADLLAKIAAGADWLVADALGAEAIDRKRGISCKGDCARWWPIRRACGAAAARPSGGLTEGLMLGGFAMQSAQASRPASGAEHQFSHLWDMQHHSITGKLPRMVSRSASAHWPSPRCMSICWGGTAEALRWRTAARAGRTMRPARRAVRALFSQADLRRWRSRRARRNGSRRQTCAGN